VAGRRQTIAGPDGRALDVYEDGDPSGVAVLVHHGTPGAGTLYGPWAADAAARGIRQIAYTRPGYGGSTRDTGRSVASAAADAAAIMDALGIERFGTWGASGGGPHALACAALLGDRVAAAATLGSIAPRAEGLDHFGGMGPEGVRELEATLAGEAELRAYIDRSVAEPPEPRVLFGQADLAALGGALGTYLVDGIRAGTEGGFDGWVDDDLAFVGPWGFDVGEIAVPVQVWQGRQDRMVPEAHGAWLARRLPRADVRISPDDGHITLLERRVGDVHAFLLQRM
jgi:pimeloyl-ACP methyl ester carboxylesterase